MVAYNTTANMITINTAPFIVDDADWGVGLGYGNDDGFIVDNILSKTNITVNKPVSDDTYQYILRKDKNNQWSLIIETSDEEGGLIEDATPVSNADVLIIYNQLKKKAVPYYDINYKMTYP